MYKLYFNSFKIEQYIDGELGMIINKSNTLYMENSAYFYTNEAYGGEVAKGDDCLNK